jgi:hypothetical protein
VSFQNIGLGPPVFELSLTNVTTPLAAARTGVSSLAIKSIAFRSLPRWAGDELLSIRCSLSSGIGSSNNYSYSPRICQLM